jgi:hypothetical protein
MAITTEEGRQMAPKVLSAINHMVRAGIVDADVNANSTITALIAAIAPQMGGGGETGSMYTAGGGSPLLRSQIARGLRMGTLSGALSESHGQTTINGLRDAVFAQIGEVGDVNYDRCLPQ